MNPFVTLILVAVVVFGGIFLIAFIFSVLFLAAGVRIEKKQYAALMQELSGLLNGDEALAEKLLSGEAKPEDCPEENREAVTAVVERYRQEQQLREDASKERQNRPTKGRLRKFLAEKKDRGEWQ